MSNTPDPNQLPRIPQVGPFRHLEPQQRRHLAEWMTGYAEGLLRKAHNRRLQSPRGYVTSAIARVALRSDFEYRSYRRLISYCGTAIENLILDDISQAVRFRDEGVRDDDVFTSDVTNDPEAELLAKERGKLQLIKKHEANIAELMDRLRRECTPEQRVTFESLIKSCGLDEIYHEFERGERKGRLDLSPKGVAQVTGMQIDTFNKHKRALKAIASRMGSFRRATSNWDR